MNLQIHRLATTMYGVRTIRPDGRTGKMPEDIPDYLLL